MAGSPGGRNPQKRVQGRNQNSVAGGVALRLSNLRIRGVEIAVKATRAARYARPGLRLPLRTKIPLQRRRANSEAPSAGCGSFQRTENGRLRRPLDFLLLVIDVTVSGIIIAAEFSDDVRILTIERQRDVTSELPPYLDCGTNSAPRNTWGKLLRHSLSPKPCSRVERNTFFPSASASGGLEFAVQPWE